MDLKEIEKMSFKDLRRIEEKRKEWKVILVLIGGYAASAYTKVRRYTKDLDFVTVTNDIGLLKGLLKDLGYDYEEKDFMLAGTKRLDGGSINLHVSIGKIHDLRTGIDYPIEDDFFNNSKEMVVRPYFEDNKELEIKTFICPIEDLLITKLTPLREKDLVDVVSLLLDNFKSIDLKRFKIKVFDAGIVGHIDGRLAEIMDLVKRRHLGSIWKTAIGTEIRLAREDHISLKKRLTQLHEILSK